ncbi:hypothetical protein ILUMI_16573, partial [Ignelater luminosus]
FEKIRRVTENCNQDFFKLYKLWEEFTNGNVEDEDIQPNELLVDDHEENADHEVTAIQLTEILKLKSTIEEKERLEKEKKEERKRRRLINKEEKKKLKNLRLVRKEQKKEKTKNALNVTKKNITNSDISFKEDKQNENCIQVKTEKSEENGNVLCRCDS